MGGAHGRDVVPDRRGGVHEGLPEALLGAAAAIERHTAGAEPVGIHLEGPFISEQRRGAHAPDWLRLPSEEAAERVLELARRCLRLITVAPELPGADALIRRMVAAGVTVSIGHTDATYEQAREAIILGATHATHCYNAMRPLHQRQPGPMAAIAEARTVRGEVIADGVHVHPAMVRLLVEMLGPDRTVVVTDALAGAGVPRGTFEFAGQRASVVRGAARLADGTIAGSVLTMDRALRNVIEMAGVSLQEAVGMLTYNPALAAGVGGRRGAWRPRTTPICCCSTSRCGCRRRSAAAPSRSRRASGRSGCAPPRRPRGREAERVAMGAGVRGCRARGSEAAGAGTTRTQGPQLWSTLRRAVSGCG